MILAGDIGGTSTRLASFTIEAGRLRPMVEARYTSRDYRGLGAIVRQFVAQHALQIQRACFGIAGPVLDGRVRTPNLPWLIDSQALAQDLGVSSVALLNDLEANAYGAGQLGEQDFAVLNAGRLDAHGNQAIISAGTGLGEAGLYWDGNCHRPFATEGGHADFAPRDDVEIQLLRFLLERFEGHVSYERVLSGPGLYQIYQFFRDRAGASEPDWLTERLRNSDAAAVIAEAALRNASTLCSHALDRFISCYGAEAGNLALKTMATGGLYVGGGIAPKILPALEKPGFMQAFSAKGRMRCLLEQIPVRVILNDRAALLGAAHYATLL